MLDRVAAAPSTGRSKQGQPVTAGTLTIIRACLRAALNDAVRQGLIARNVATLVTLPSVRRPEPVAVPSNRLGLFLHQVEGDRLEAMWLTDAVYGMRRGDERAAYGSTYLDHSAVFCEPDGSPLRPSKVSAWFKGHVVASGAAAGMDKVPSLKALRSSP